MILEEYITDKGKPLMFSNERSRCFGIIKIGFDRVFRATSSWEVDYCWTSIHTRTETDGGFVCDSICNTSRALLRPGRTLEQVRFKEITTSKKFYATINFDFRMLNSMKFYFKMLNSMKFDF